MRTSNFWAGLIGGIIGWAFLYPQLASSQLLQPSAKEVIEVNCLSCHSGEKPSGNTSLESWSKVVLKTTPGDAQSSHLVRMILWMQKGKPQMPLARPPLSWREINAIRRWIDTGATEKGYEEKFQMHSMGGNEQK